MPDSLSLVRSMPPVGVCIAGTDVFDVLAPNAVRTGDPF